MIAANRVIHNISRLHVLTFIIGLWIIAAPFILHYSQTASTVNEVISGLIIIALSATSLHTSSDNWQSWSLAGMGLWVVLSPFIFGYSHATIYWNQLLFGIILIIVMLSAVSSSIRNHSHLAH